MICLLHEQTSLSVTTLIGEGLYLGSLGTLKIPMVKEQPRFQHFERQNLQRDAVCSRLFVPSICDLIFSASQQPCLDVPIIQLPQSWCHSKCSLEKRICISWQSPNDCVCTALSFLISIITKLIDQRTLHHQGSCTDHMKVRLGSLWNENDT